MQQGHSFILQHIFQLLDFSGSVLEVTKLQKRLKKIEFCLRLFLVESAKARESIAIVFHYKDQAPGPICYTKAFGIFLGPT